MLEQRETVSVATKTTFLGNEAAFSRLSKKVALPLILKKVTLPLIFEGPLYIAGLK